MREGTVPDDKSRGCNDFSVSLPLLLFISLLLLLREDLSLKTLLLVDNVLSTSLCLRGGDDSIDVIMFSMPLSGSGESAVSNDTRRRGALLLVTLSSAYPPSRSFNDFLTVKVHNNIKYNMLIIINVLVNLSKYQTCRPARLKILEIQFFCALISQSSKPLPHKAKILAYLSSAQQHLFNAPQENIRKPIIKMLTLNSAS